MEEIQKEKGNQSRGKILVVDDDINVLETLRAILASAGYDVEIAANGKQALDLLGSGLKVNLIITDIMMPQMDGMEFLRQSHDLRKGVPVFILTAYPSVDNVLQALKEGVRDYIPKPFKMDELLQKVKEALKMRAIDKWF